MTEPTYRMTASGEIEVGSPDGGLVFAKPLDDFPIKGIYMTWSQGLIYLRRIERDDGTVEIRDLTLAAIRYSLTRVRRANAAKVKPDRELRRRLRPAREAKPKAGSPTPERRKRGQVEFVIAPSGARPDARRNTPDARAFGPVVARRAQGSQRFQSGPSQVENDHGPTVRFLTPVAALGADATRNTRRNTGRNTQRAATARMDYSDGRCPVCKGDGQADFRCLVWQGEDCRQAGPAGGDDAQWGLTHCWICSAWERARCPATSGRSRARPTCLPASISSCSSHLGMGSMASRPDQNVNTPSSEGPSSNVSVAHSAILRLDARRHDSPGRGHRNSRLALRSLHRDQRRAIAETVEAAWQEEDA